MGGGGPKQQCVLETLRNSRNESVSFYPSLEPFMSDDFQSDHENFCVIKVQARYQKYTIQEKGNA